MRPLPVLRGDFAADRLPPKPRGFGIDALVDSKERRYTYLRLSVTDRCDLACVYCMPPGGEEDHGRRPELLTFEEAARVVNVFASLGVGRVRLTGGEPLVRKDVVRLVQLLRRQPDPVRLAMTSNGTRLAELARPLALAGLTELNVSLDSLDPERFRRITRGGDLGQVLAGIHASLDAGLEVKINVVALAGINDDDWGNLVDWAWSLGITPRFIERMPLGEGAKLDASTFANATAIIERLGSRVVQSHWRPLDLHHGPARYLSAASSEDHRVGFITAVSEEFCGSCNRVRITARGDIRACLASRRAVSLRDLIRSGADDDEIAWGIHWSLIGKAEGHSFLDADADEHHHVGMSLVGG